MTTLNCPRLLRSLYVGIELGNFHGKYEIDALNSSEQTICLLYKHDIELYKSQSKFLHIGMGYRNILAALRDAQNLNFRQSLMGSIESNIGYGDIKNRSILNKLRLSIFG
ncbi:hypothetical protein H5410_064730 [Solanum commersonii]|uniref:Uncharacterized protein n=1 Tax=Solanum commersonii TaxID=4109 RepID=A0A9J5VYJ5_SOLCO|nr:hypothetical protein H5410_064730 [Solanum commersonii]